VTAEPLTCSGCGNYPDYCICPTPDDPWPTPEPLGDGHDAPPFPIDALPEWIGAHVRQVAEELQLPPDLPAMLAITALSIACARNAEVVVRGTWREPLNTYLATAMPPGAGKSPAVREMLACLDRYEAQLIERSIPERDRTETRRAILEKEKAKAINAGDTAGALVASDELRTLPRIVEPRLMADDVTPEKLGEMLDDHGGRMAIVSTEGGVFGLMTGRYSDKSNLNVFLQAWSGDAIRVDRIGRRSSIVLEPALSIGLTVQPSVIADLADHPELAGRGLTARFMYSFPLSNVGYRDMARDATMRPAVAEAYNAKVVSIADGFDPQAARTVVTVTDEALELYTTWRQDMEDRCRPGGDLHHMTEWVTKLGSTGARLAGLLALANDTKVVDADIMERAIAIGRYWEAHARVAHDIWGAEVDTHRAGKVLDWLAETQPERFSLRDVYRNIRSLDAPQAADAVSLLVDKSWLRRLDDRPIVTGRPGVPSPEFVPHPDLTSFRNNHGDMSRMSPRTEFESLTYSWEGQVEVPGQGQAGHTDMIVTEVIHRADSAEPPSPADFDPFS
jgi:hypothetical protein